jgi:hypothetical protein
MMRKQLNFIELDPDFSLSMHNFLGRGESWSREKVHNR